MLSPGSRARVIVTIWLSLVLVIYCDGQQSGEDAQGRRYSYSGQDQNTDTGTGTGTGTKQFAQDFRQFAQYLV